MTDAPRNETESPSADTGAREEAPKTDSEAGQELDSRPEEAGKVLAAGPKAGNRAGALAFLAFAVVIAAAVHFHMTDSGGEYLQRLDAELLRNAELSLKAGGGAAVAVAPSWPLELYGKIRADIALYAAAAVAVAYLWQLSARSRARRDAFLLHDALTTELAALRERVAVLETREEKQNSD